MRPLQLDYIKGEIYVVGRFVLFVSFSCPDFQEMISNNEKIISENNEAKIQKEIYPALLNVFPTIILSCFMLFLKGSIFT